LLREIAETLLLTMLIFWAVNAATGRFRIDGSSMEPNLHDGEYIIINKLVYQLREPQRGDVVVFQYPHDPSRDFIKRVIGIPGDEVTIERGIVSINGHPIEEPYIAQPGAYSGHWKLGPDEFFVLGDNRNNSSDSHNWGVLPRDNLIGRAWVIYWPVQDWGSVPHTVFDLNKGTASAAGN
jgi:signal peptidase I